YPRKAELALLDKNAGGDAERNAGEQLIGDAEQWPKDVDTAVRIDHADVEEVAPSCHDERARDENRGVPGGLAERLPHMTERILQHESPHSSARIQGREDEDRLEHDRAVVQIG